MLAFMKELLDKFLTLLLTLFPLSPFAPAIKELGSLPYLKYINWLVPVGDLVKMGTLWLAAIGAYYAWSVVARWVKLLS